MCFDHTVFDISASQRCSLQHCPELRNLTIHFSITVRRQTHLTTTARWLCLLLHRLPVSLRDVTLYINLRDGDESLQERAFIEMPWREIQANLSASIPDVSLHLRLTKQRRGLRSIDQNHITSHNRNRERMDSERTTQYTLVLEQCLQSTPQRMDLLFMV